MDCADNIKSGYCCLGPSKDHNHTSNSQDRGLSESQFGAFPVNGPRGSPVQYSIVNAQGLLDDIAGRSTCVSQDAVCWRAFVLRIQLNASRHTLSC